MGNADESKHHTNPPCHACGAERVQRINGKTKQSFTGCSAFPKCRWTAQSPRRQIATNAEGMHAMTVDEVGDYDERDPMLDSYGDFHDY